MNRGLSPSRWRIRVRRQQRRLANSGSRLLSVAALVLTTLFYQNCANSSSASSSFATVQSQVIRESLTDPTPGMALGFYDLLAIRSVEYRFPAGGFPSPGIHLDHVSVVATFQGSSLLPVKVSWDIVDFDTVQANCYVFIDPLVVHADYVNVLLQRLAQTSLVRARMPPGQVMTCLDCKSDPLLKLTLMDTTSHSYLFDHQNLDSTPVTEIRDPNGSLEASLAAFVTHVNDAANPKNLNNHCQDF